MHLEIRGHAPSLGQQVVGHVWVTAPLSRTPDERNVLVRGASVAVGLCTDNAEVRGCQVLLAPPPPTRKFILCIQLTTRSCTTPAPQELYGVLLERC